MGGGGQGGCERRFEVFVKIKKKIGGRVGRESGLGGVGVRLGGHDGYERRIEVFVKIKKKSGVGLGGSRGWVG